MPVGILVVLVRNQLARRPWVRLLSNFRRGINRGNGSADEEEEETDGNENNTFNIDLMQMTRDSVEVKTKGRPPGVQNKERKPSQPKFQETFTRRERSRFGYEEAAEARQDENQWSRAAQKSRGKFRTQKRAKSRRTGIKGGKENLKDVKSVEELKNIKNVGDVGERMVSVDVASDCTIFSVDSEQKNTLVPNRT